jgi:hypothetical protein
LEDELGVAYADNITRCQALGAGYPHLIDVGPVFAAQIVNKDGLALVADLGVMAGHKVILQCQVIVRVATDGHNRFCPPQFSEGR